VKKGVSPEPARLTPRQLKQYCERVEQDIIRLEAQREKTENEMADPTIYSDAERMRELLAAYEKAKLELANLYEHWERLAEQLSAIKDA
jgi:hypothetical protein